MKTTTQAMEAAAKKHGAEFSSNEFARDHFAVGALWMKRHLAARAKKSEKPRKSSRP